MLIILVIFFYLVWIYQFQALDRKLSLIFFAVKFVVSSDKFIECGGLKVITLF